MSAPLVFGNPVQTQETNNVTNFRGRQTPTPDAYINLSLPRTDGKDGKLDRGIRLFFSDNDPAQKQLAEYLQTEEGIEWFRRNLHISCNIVGTGPKAGFAFDK